MIRRDTSTDGLAVCLRSALVEVGAVRHWASPLGKEPIAFKVLLLCDDDEQASRLRHDIAGSPGLSR